MPRKLALLSAASLAFGLSACGTLGQATTGVATTAGPTHLIGLQKALESPVATLVGPGELSHASLTPSMKAMDPRVNPTVAATAAIPPGAAPMPRSQSYVPQQQNLFTYSGGQMNVGDLACPPASGGCPPSVLPHVDRIALPVVEGVERPVTSSELYPDEYICDGGDEGFPTSVGKDGRVILKFEETVGTFLDDEATRHVEASNRVCMYAPTFGAVRTISQPVIDQVVSKVAGAHDTDRVAGHRLPVGPNVGEQVDAGMQTRMRSRMTELEVRKSRSAITNVTKLTDHAKVLNLFQEYNFQNDIELSSTTLAVLNEGIANAIAWQQSDAPVIVGRDDTLLQIRAEVIANEYVVVEDRRRDGALQILKTADVKSAQPGEEVNFAIRFDNTGGKPVFDVTVIDHLSPRLELIEGSVSCDIAGDVTVEDDYEGSVYLKVRLKKPLDPNKGGVLTFTCRVR